MGHLKVHFYLVVKVFFALDSDVVIPDPGAGVGSYFVEAEIVFIGLWEVQHNIYEIAAYAVNVAKAGSGGKGDAVLGRVEFEFGDFLTFGDEIME